MANDSSKGTSAPDTEKLAEDIERTREGLAVTLDAIADKVSPKRVVDRTKTQAKADAQQAVVTIKEASAHAAEVVKEKVAVASASGKVKAAAAAESGKVKAAAAAESGKVKAAAAAESVKSCVTQVKERVGNDDPVRSPLAPATSVEVGAATPVASTGALADATVVQTEPAGADAPAWTPYPASDPADKTPLIAGAGAGAAVLVLLLVLRRSRRGRRRRR